MMINKRTVVMILGGFLLAVLPHGLKQASAQTRAPQSNWSGHWNWAVYAKDKSELPPAYQDAKNVREIPAYALDLTLRQRGNRLRGTWGVLARYFARIDEGDLSTTIKGNRATIHLQSNFLGSATILLTMRGNKIHWKLISSSGEQFFPLDQTLRRLRRGEKLPYVASDNVEEPE